MARPRKAVGRRSIVTQAQIKKAASKVRLHFHKPPRCSGGKHDPKCGKRKEVFCASAKVGPFKFCSCGHV